MNSCSTWQFIF